MIDAPVVWLAEETPDAARALSQWASARGVRIVAHAAPLPSRPYTPTLANDVETALAKAREAVAVLDADSAERQLARAEQLLRTHPELPQAAWLMAEVQRGWASRFDRVEPRDALRAKRAALQADALDGGRAAGLGEPESSKPVLVDVTLDATSDPDLVWLLDARPVAPGKIKAAGGEHHLAAIANGRVRFADWVTVIDGAKLKLDVRGRVPCSTDDLKDAHVQCGAWITATPAPKGVTASLCHGTSCETASFFAVRVPRWPPIDEPPRSKGIPAWITWSIVGVTAVGAAFAILAGAGVFAPAEHRIVFMQGGVHPE